MLVCVIVSVSDINLTIVGIIFIYKSVVTTSNFEISVKRKKVGKFQISMFCKFNHIPIDP